MKILFAIQGTGNGHLSRARDIYPELTQYGSVDVLVSGIQADVDVPFPVKYRYYGMSFIFGKKGGVAMWQTARRLKLIRLLKDIRRLPVDTYDLVINDFEPVSAWACKLKRVPCIGLSHQSAVLHPNAPAPAVNDWRGKLILKRYAPVTDAYGFHFNKYAPQIFTPVIRQQVREARRSYDGHYTVYLPAYDDKVLIKHLSAFAGVHWEVFSKHNATPYEEGNILVQPIENNAFIKSLATATGVLCGAGFEAPAETLYLGKKLLAIPMRDQYEQHCNAAALADMGIPIIPELHRRHYPVIRQWLDTPQHITVHYPDETAAIIRHLMQKHACAAHANNRENLLSV